MSLRHRFIPRLAEVDAARWDALRGSDDPFTSHAFLSGLEETGCLRPRWGWTPHHLIIEDEADGLLAAAPCYLKTNSHGEFVFDHAWAEAYYRAGLDYFPKLLVAVPYSPVTGPRLLCGGDAQLRAELLRALEGFASEHQLSGAHINFHPAEASPGGAWLARSDLQFHWHNAGYASFEAFLAALSSKKRKNLRQERAQVARAGIRLRRVPGHLATREEIATAHQLYCRTFDDKGNHAALTLDFFEHLARQLGQRFVLVLAERDAGILAMALCLRSSDTLYGRYWGCFEEVPGLHFECCYHQGIEYCIEQGLQRFEPGAQGEHKLARGFLPELTHSSHYLPMPAFREAVARSLEDERRGLAQYRKDLLAHSPYRAEGASG
ncbi:MAG: N-acetyltransferase [Xanthomonadales bacterium]|nr:N-acetyltransferase [Xanthomonadales bacterium]